MAQPGHDLFIAFASGDAAWADRIANELTRRGLSVSDVSTWDQASVDTRQSAALPDEEIHATLNAVRNVVVLWSDAARSSEWVRRELDIWNKVRANRPGDINSERGSLIVVMLEGEQTPTSFGPALVLSHLRDFAEYSRGVDAVSAETWSRLLDDMVKGLQQAAPRPSARRKTGKATASSSSRGAAASAASASSSSAPPEPEPAAFGADALASFDLLRPVSEIARSAAHLASSAVPPAPITPTSLLIAIAARGQAAAGGFWAADWLFSRLTEEGVRRLSSEFLARHRIKVPRWSGVGPLPFDVNEAPAVGLAAGAMRTFERARDIALRTSQAERIHTRHLLAALLLDADGSGPDGAVAQLTAIGQDTDALREAYFGWVRGYGDDDDAWGALLLGERRAAAQLTGFDADDSRGEDFLDVRPDVLAFAGLIAARTLAPPLSIGLFGEWGSGKTFFMRMLQKEVARLARQAREESRTQQLRQRDQLFYRRIVQVEFNAWHYVEGNLWASLVQHILDNLRVIDDKQRRASRELQEPILRKLGVEKAAAADAERERQQAERRRATAQQELSKARGRFEEKAKELASLSGENFLADLPLPALRQAIAPTLEKLGLDVLTDQALELRGTIAEARALVTRGNAAITPLLHGKDRPRRWQHLLLALLAGPAVALLAGAVVYALGAESMATLAAMASGAAAFLATGTRWLKQQLITTGEAVSQLESAQKKLDESIAKAQAENLQKVREAEEQLRLLEADYVAAKRKEEEANRRVADAEARLANASVARLLTSFIEDRANSNDYRKHLGVLALVRNDFERLSDLIAEENERLSAPDQDPLGFPSFKDEYRDEQNRINRIVLYIDDLDRCPPAKVVEVLQAVHLLLAFPLFVVVVGVDARWLVRSLDVRYRELLRTSTRSEDISVNEFDQLFGSASAHDYVEKIFQVPFWLKPMAEDDTRRMVQGLLRATMTPSAPKVPAAQTTGVPAPAGPAENAVPAVTAAPAPVEQQVPAPIDGAAQVQVVEPAAAVRQETDLAPESLEISASEVEFIKALAPLLGRSPRTLKRFVNVYRLIKVGLSPYERHVFLNDAAALPDYRAVLLLLAVDTGAPLLAPVMFTVLRDLAWARIPGPAQKGVSRPLAPTLDNVIAQLDAHSTTEHDAGWQRVKSWLLYGPEKYRLPQDVSSLARWVPHVSRFSFHTGRI